MWPQIEHEMPIACRVVIRPIKPPLCLSRSRTYQANASGLVEIPLNAQARDPGPATA